MVGYSRFYTQKRASHGGLFPGLCPEEGLPWWVIPLFYAQKRASHGCFTSVLCPEEDLPWVV